MFKLSRWHARLLLAAVFFKCWTVARSQQQVLDTSNLKNCLKYKTHCDNWFRVKSVLVRCLDYGRKTCAHHCPLGQPLISQPSKNKRSCAQVCPGGYFVTSVGTEQTCQLHRSTCPPGETKIVRGTVWHDTVCGRPEEYALLEGSRDVRRSPALHHALNELTRAWIYDLDENAAYSVCSFVSVSIARTFQICTADFAPLFRIMGQDLAENLYFALNRVGAYVEARKMYEQVLKPLMGEPKGPRAEPTVFLEPAGPLWVEEGTQVTIVAKIVFPSGMRTKNHSFTFEWNAAGRWLLKGNGTKVVFADKAKYEFAPNAGLWYKDYKKYFYPDGSFVEELDVSLLVKGFVCGLFESASLRVDFATGGPSSTTDVKIGCLSPGCNCTRDLLRYGSPAGPCSPVCALIGLRRAYPSDGFNDWTLVVSGEQSSIRAARGRTLWGTTTRKTERLCSATTEVFNGSPSPRRGSPNPPLDVKSCDVMLLEVPVLLDDTVGRDDGPYLSLAVRQASKKSQKKLTGPSVPLRTKETLHEMIRQEWGGKIGVRIVRPKPKGRGLSVEETSAVLDWLLSGCPELKVAVLDADPREPTFWSYFQVLRNMYGSRVDVLPALSGETLAHLMSVRYGNEKRFACTKAYSECSKIRTLYGEDGKVLYRQQRGRPLLDCGPMKASGQNCTMCRERDTVYALCPADLRPAEVSQKGSETPEPALWLETSQVEEAEAALQEAGEVASQRGALLDLDSWMDRLERPCEWTKPRRWPFRKYDSRDPHSTRLIAEEALHGLTGLSVFVELGRRSNNGAGIAVTLPTARYELNADCTAMRKSNRHAERKSSASHLYSAGELGDIVSDMARWGVTRYSLGCLDHTFGRPSGTPLFAELAAAIDSAARQFGTLHYSYTRSSLFEDGGLSHVRVNGIYKLEEGMFFQRAAENDPLAKGFVSIPGVPGLRLGLSSRMNIGDPLEGGGAQLLRERVEVSNSVPVGARVVRLTPRGNIVAFVHADRIYIYQGSTTEQLRQAGLRTQVSRTRSEKRPLCKQRTQSEYWGIGCCSRRVRGNQTNVRLEVSVPSPTKPEMKAVLRKLLESAQQLPPLVLTKQEAEWLSGKGGSEETNPAISGPWKARDMLSLVLECFAESGSCLELADFAEGDWPEGATGYPAALQFAVHSGDNVLLRILLRAEHGAILTVVPCNLEPFSFGSEGPRHGLQSYPGFFARPRERVHSASRDCARKAQSLALSTSISPAPHHCNTPPEGGSPLSRFLGCLQYANGSLARLASEVLQLETRAQRDDALERRAYERRALAMERSSALCVTAVMVSILINGAMMAALCTICTRSRTPRYRKLK